MTTAELDHLDSLDGDPRVTVSATGSWMDAEA